jgi:hypothetical protein
MCKVAVFQRTKLLWIMLIIVALLVLSLSSVGAASWSKDKWASCSSGVPQGLGWVLWSGYPFYSSQYVTINFFWWDGSNWLIMGADTSGWVFGGSGYAEAYNSVSYHSGSWQMPTRWEGSIVNTSEFPFFSCS